MNPNPRCEALELRRLLAVTASFTSSSGTLTVIGDTLDNAITLSRDAAGKILVNGGAVAVVGGTPTVANTSLIQAFGQAGNDSITMSEVNGALPRCFLFGGAGNDVLTGGSGADQLFGQADNDTELGKGGNDLLFGGDGNDVLTGGDADDQVFGEAGSDRMIWNPGDDTDLNEGGDGTDTTEVNGGNGAETFTVTANGTRVRFDRTTPAPFSLDVGTTENLVVNCNGGDDIFTAGNGLAALIAITADGGTGNDQVTGGDGADALLGGDGNDVMTGGRGNDVILAGAGSDSFIWNPGDGSDIDEGQADADSLQFNGANIAEKIDILANGGRVRFTRDIGSVVMDLNDVETINFAALGGADDIAVNDLAGTDVTQVNVNLAASGGAVDGASDTVTVNSSASSGVADTASVTDQVAGTAVTGLATSVLVSNADTASDTLKLNTFGGSDLIVVNQSAMAGAVRKLAVNAGTETDTITVLGTAADGLVTIAPSTGNDTVNVNTDLIGISNVAFDATQRIGLLNIQSGGAATLTSGGAKVLTVTTLLIGGSGKLNLSDNDMIIDYTGASPIATVQSLINKGYNGGAWNGNGISTSFGNAANFALGYAEASEVAPGGSFSGQPVDSTAVVVKFTYYGDANLDGKVDVVDLGRLATNWQRSPRRWSAGDFSYDNVVDIIDLGLLATNWQSGVNSPL